MRVLVVDDHALIRDGLQTLLELHDVEVVGAARNGREAVDLARSTQPDVVLMDLEMPGMSGLSATRLISATHPHVRVVMLALADDDPDLFEAILSGAYGYVLKHSGAGELIAQIRSTADGEPLFTAELAGQLIREANEPVAPDPPTGPRVRLLAIETAVLRLLALGITAHADLAARLRMGEDTVRTHLRAILNRLHADHREEVVAFAARYETPGGTQAPERLS